jgi:hypothetical protein
LQAVADIAKYAAQLGREDILKDVVPKMELYAGSDSVLLELREKYSVMIEGLGEIRKRIIEISLVGRGQNEIRQALDRVSEFQRYAWVGSEETHMVMEPIGSLREANALTVGPVIRWWEDLDETDYKAAALDYDYWGRGCFARILRNLQAFPHSLNVTVEVRSVSDIRNALRLWSLYADFILMIWKGPTNSGRFVHMIDGEWFGPWGAGYMLAMKDKYLSRSGRLRFPALGYGSWLPEDVAKCLKTEARGFLASGRLLVVPASGVGCVSPGHGVIEQLLTEVANCIPAIQQRQDAEIGLGLLPYARDIPLDVLLDFVNEHEDELGHMRRLMLGKANDIRRNGLQQPEKAMERDIAEAIAGLRHHNAALAKRGQLT